MRILMILIPMMFLTNGCRKKIICKEIKAARIKPLVFCDVSFSPVERCRCRCFDMLKYETVEDHLCNSDDGEFKSGNLPIIECDQIAGPSINDWARYIKPNIKRLKSIEKTYCK